MNDQRRGGPARRPAIESLEGRALMATLALGPPKSSAANLDAAYNNPAVTGDFNRDGKADLVVASYDAPVGGKGPEGPGIFFLQGKGDGSFRNAGFTRTDFSTNAIVTGDFNRDGKLDVAIAGVASSKGKSIDGVEILLGVGNGTFRKGGDFALASLPLSMAAGDFNRDGKADLAVGELGTPTGSGRGVALLAGNGNGTFKAAKFTATDVAPGQLLVGDLDKNGDLDLAAVDSSYYDPKDGGVSILLGHGDGTFARPAHIALNNQPVVGVLADLNHDGKLDLALAYDGIGPNQGGVEVLLGKGRGAFGAATRTALKGYPDGIAAGDLNGDGKVDLAVATVISPASGKAAAVGGVDVLAGNGAGKFGPTTYFNDADGPTQVLLADLNGDRKLDVVTIDSGGGFTTPEPSTHGDVIVRLNKTKA